MLFPIKNKFRNFYKIKNFMIREYYKIKINSLSDFSELIIYFILFIKIIY